MLKDEHGVCPKMAYSLATRVSVRVWFYKALRRGTMIHHYSLFLESCRSKTTQSYFLCGDPTVSCQNLTTWKS